MSRREFFVGGSKDPTMSAIVSVGCCSKALLHFALPEDIQIRFSGKVILKKALVAKGFLVRMKNHLT